VGWVVPKTPEGWFVKAFWPLPLVSVTPFVPQNVYSQPVGPCRQVLRSRFSSEIV
jgi:hypothetical protein